MTVAILLMTHPGIATALRDTAALALGKLPAPVEILEVDPEADIDTQIADARATLEALARFEGVLICADLYGASPANIARRVLDPERHALVTGVNLPMLIRCLNYAELPLGELTEKALEGGLRSIFRAPPLPETP
ncbi:MAG: PTS fructose transporter subunit IIA [Pseudomonadota bacterium]